MGGRSLTHLRLQGIEKSYDGVRVLHAVDLDLFAGEIHALVGENGAGKSTLLKVLTGVVRPDGGLILLDHRAIAPRTPLEAQRLGIAAIHQEVGLIPQLSLAENLFLGRQPRRSGWIPGLDWRAMQRRARERLVELGLEVDPRRPAGSFPVAVQQLAAIARALDLEARCLVLDEPTSSLDADESARLYARLFEMRARGLSLLFVSHSLDEVFALADRITVLRGGRRVATQRASEVGREALVRQMIGRDLSELPSRERAGRSHLPAQPPLLRTRGLARAGAIGAFELALAAGEVTALAGLLGSGRSELARLLFGADRADAGTLEVDGVARELRTPRDGLRLGLAYLPEDRRREGVLPGLSVRDNVAIALAARRSPLGWLPRARRRALADELIARLGVVCDSPDQPISTLSGGNQQKALIARWLATAPRVWIADEPSRGVDLGAREEIERQLSALAHAGAAILFVSSSLDEVVRLAERALVLRERAVVGELSGADLREEALVRLMGGGVDGR